MANCEYRVRGKINRTHNEIFNYVANTAPESRSSEEIYKSLREAGIAIRKKDRAGNPRMYLVMGQDSSINMIKAQDINTGARKFFGIGANERLLDYTNLGQRSNKFTGINTLYGLSINEDVLRKMKSKDREKIAKDQATADEIASMLSSSYSPFRDDYLLSEMARQENRSERSKFSRMAEARVDNATRQIKKMKDAFAKAGVEVEVVLDGDIDAKGVLLGVTPENPVPRILLNPNEISEDTVYHEFAHLYVDLLGYNHPLVQEAIQQLRGTALYEEVKQHYPELEGDQERLDKEVLATAIGLEGARIERKNPSKLQQILNRIFRAIGNLLGVSTNGAAQLARQMIVNELDSTQFLGALAPYAQQSKAERNVQKIVRDLKVRTETAILKLESQPTKNETAINELRLQQKKLDSITEVEQLIDFVNYTTRLAARAEQTFERIKTEYSSDPELITGPARLEMLQQLHQVHTWLQAFHNQNVPGGSTMTAIKRELRKKTTKVEAQGGDIAELTSFKNRLADAIDIMDELEQDYIEVGIPIQADLLLEYNTPEINNKIDETIQAVRTSGREIGLNKKSKEYRELKSQLKNKEISKEEFKERKIQLNVEQLQSRKIGRETIINELREPQKNKSWLSYMLDPIIYSSQPAIQLFSTHLKAAILRANEKFRETQYSLQDIYREYAATRGAGIDEAAFNDPILDVYEYDVIDWKNTTENGEPTTKKMRLLSFVQPYDVGAYYQAETDARLALAKKYERPTETEDLKAWNRSKKAQQYFNELNNWYKENSVPVEGAQKMYDEMRSKRDRLKKDLQAALDQGMGEKAALLEAEINSLNIQMASSYDFKSKQFKGLLAQPGKKYESEKYKELTKDKNSVEYRYYTALLEEYKKSQGKLGRTNQVRNNWENFSYILPTVRKSSLNKTIEGATRADGKNLVSAGKDMIKDTFEVLETDTDYGVLVGLNGERLQTVPVFFTNPVDERDISRDAIGSILKFANMSNLFEEKSKILGSVEMMRDIIESRGTLELDEQGNPGFNKIARKFKGMAQKVKQDPKIDPDNQLLQLSEFIDSVFYGEKDLKQALGKSINILGKEFNIEGTKLTRTATFLTAVTALAGNKLQAVNQVIIDNQRLVEEALAREFYRKRDIAKAHAEYTKNILNMKTAKDMGAFTNQSKMLQAADIFDAFNDFSDSAGNNVSGNRAKKLLSEDTAFVMQNLAEHQTAVTRMLALLYSYEGKLKDKDGNVLMNEEGKPANMYDMLIKDEKGMYKIDPRVANVTQLEIVNKLSAVQKKTNQLKGSHDRAMAERRSIGKLATLFRRFLAPGFRRNWGHGGLGNVSYLHIDTEAGTISEGAYFTAFKYLRDQVKNILDGDESTANIYNLMTKEEKANVKRAASQGLFYAAAMSIAGLLIGAAADEDDPEAKSSYLFWAYQARRLQTEIGAFLNPREVYNITKSPSAAARPLMNIYDLITHVAFKEIPYAVGVDVAEKDLFYQRKSGKYNKGDRKTWAKFEKVLPIWSGLNKDAERAIKWFDLNG